MNNKPMIAKQPAVIHEADQTTIVHFGLNCENGLIGIQQESQMTLITKENWTTVKNKIDEYYQALKDSLKGPDRFETGACELPVGLKQTEVVYNFDMFERHFQIVYLKDKDNNIQNEHFLLCEKEENKKAFIHIDVKEIFFFCEIPPFEIVKPFDLIQLLTQLAIEKGTFDLYAAIQECNEMTAISDRVI